MEQLTSNLKWYSLGIVVKTKEDGTDIILVSPIEHLAMTGTGLISESKNDRSNKLPDQDGVKTHTEVSSVNYVKASWRALGSSNRLSPPDVVANETVLLLKYGDVDEYFWTTIGNEPGLRRKEDVLYGLCNIPDGFKVFDKTTSYWFQWSTKQKFVTLRTSVNDGEYTGYTVHIDTKKGNLSISDDKGNNIVIDSVADKISLNSKHIELNGSETIVFNSRSITSNSDELVINASTSTVNSSDTTINGSSFTNNVSDITNNANSTSENSSSYTLNSPSKNVSLIDHTH